MTTHLLILTMEKKRTLHQDKGLTAVVPVNRLIEVVKVSFMLSIVQLILFEVQSVSIFFFLGAFLCLYDSDRVERG